MARNKTNNCKEDNEMRTSNTSKPSRPKGRGKSGKSKFRDNDYKKDSKRFGANDISWYATDPTLLRNAGNLPWSTQTGISYKSDYVWENSDGSIGSSSVYDTVPGIMAAYLLTGPGRTDADIDAVNISSNAIYTFVRHMNSGSKNYDAPNMMSYLLSMDEVFTYINWLQRLYGTIAAYNVFNRYTPEALIRAQGVDYAGLRDNMVQFKYRVNLAIKQASTLVVPNNLPIYFRHAWLFQNYYIEGNDIKDQIYFYSPISFKQLDPTTGNLRNIHIWDTQSGVTRNMIPDYVNSGNLVTWDCLCDRLDDMLRVLYTNEDTGIMAGDILKAYGESNIMRLSELPDAYITPILPNNEVLLQFKNSTAPFYLNSVLQDPTEFGGGTFGDIILDPNTNKIYWDLNTADTQVTSGVYSAIENNHILTLEGDPSVEMNMIMTRLTSYSKTNGGASTLPSFSYYCGTEIIGWYTVVMDPDPYNTFRFRTTMDASSQATISATASKLSNFKYHPRVVFMPSLPSGWRSSSALPSYFDNVYQVDNFTYIDTSTLDRLHQVAIMSELNVPHLALAKG